MAGPLPAVRYCTDTPSAVAVRTAIAALAPGVCCCARGATGCATSARTNANTQTQCRLATRSLLNREHCRYARLRCRLLHRSRALRRVQARVDPRGDVGHHRVITEVVEEVVKMPVIQLQGLVRRTGAVVEKLAPARFGGFVFCPMKNEQRQSDAHELLLEPLVRTNQLGNCLGRLRLVRDERIAVHGGHDLRITGEVLILETQDVSMRRNVTESL